MVLRRHQFATTTPVCSVSPLWTRPTPMPWLIIQRQTVEPAGGVARSRTSYSTVQLLVLWPVTQEAECRPLLAASCYCTYDSLA
ncbi:hypothetical protein ACQJBY_022367 [Aegilops geniculata]